MKSGHGLNVGIIGLGSMGQHHARIIQTIAVVKLTAVCDTDEQKLSAFSCQKFTNYQDVLKEVDAVIIASPTSAHLEIGLAAIEAKKHLLIEKPLAGNYKDAKILVNNAKNNRVLLTVGMIERFNPAFHKLRKTIKKEKALELIFKRFSPYPERISDASVVFDMMIHDIDLAINLAESEVEDIKASGKKEKSDRLDQCSATLYFKNGLIAKLEANRIFSVKTRKIEVFCERNNYEVDLLNKKLLLSPSPIEKLEIPVESTDQLTLEIKNFIRAIIDDKPLEVLPEQALEGIRIAEEIEKLAS